MNNEGIQILNLDSKILKQIIKEAIEEASATKEEKATLTIDECTKFTGIGRDKLMELAHSKRHGFPCFKVGYRFLVNKELLTEWLEKISREGITL